MDVEPWSETVDYVAITRLQAAYADCVTRRAWGEFGQLFLPTATIEVDTVTADPLHFVGPNALARFIAEAIERFEFFEFAILNAVVSLGVDGDPDMASGRIFMCELRQERSNGHPSQAFGVYRDRYQRVDGRWWFAERRYQSLARTARPEVFPMPTDILAGGEFPPD
ncbi:MAG: nuclear transport factor 2 family protein [Acidimicrobiales bacterium]